MNAEGLLMHYSRIVDAPDAIEKLRRLVLNLAACGKLVAPRPGDEPAAALLERISTETERLTEQGKFKEPRSFIEINRGELPFAPPSHWAWTRLIEIARPSYGFAFASGKFNSSGRGMPLIRIRDISGVDTEAYFDGPFDTAYVVKAGDYLVGMDGDFNLRRWRGKDGLLNQRVMRINDWKSGVNPEFVKLPLQFVLDYLHGNTSQTTVKHLSAKQVNGIEIPLPPAAEQERIVAKVHELMALCDQLETARAQREATRDRLAAASLARLNAPDPDTFHADARFALDALPAITTRPNQIKQLRQTILNLAVRGKLVPQDPSNEPATSLLKKIASLRSKKLEEGYPNEAEARAQLKKSLAQRVPDQIEPLPAGWTWATLMQCSILVVDCKNKTAPYAKSGIRLIRTTNVRDGQMNSTDQKYVDQRTYEQWSTRCTPEPGDVLITREAPMGEVCLIPPGERICLGQRMMLARLPADLMDPRFVIYSLQDPRLMDRVQDKPIGATVQHLRVGGVETLLMPVPPLEEQHRIVAKLDKLMALCDQLEASLTTGETTRSRLLDALLHEALATAPAVNIEHPRAAVSGYLVSRLASRRNFGRTAHMKHLYLAESRLGLKLGGRYMREAAGPLDNGIYALEKQAEAAHWYTARVETLPSGKEKVNYMPGKALKALTEEGVAVLGPSRAEMDRLIDLMGGLKTEQVEIIATLFAAWNDALLDGQAPDDDWIVKEVREHWHVSKQRFNPAELHKWLEWMRQNDVVPLGHPPRTMQQTTMEL